MKKINVFKWVFFSVSGLLLLINLNVAVGQSVETNSKVAPHLKPAFAGQTRVPAVKTNAKFSFKVITEGLASPWGLDFLPDGRMIVSELEGKIRIVSKDGQIGNPLKNVPAVRTVGVSGMMDVKVSPDFARNRWVFWTYAEPTADDQGVNCLARGVLSADETALENVQVILRATTPAQDGFHLGSRMLFDQNGTLLVTMGDRVANEVRIKAQDLTSHVGKILRINQDGTPAVGNPFNSTNGNLKEVWSIGHRNPQGLAFNPVTGDLWESEHGPRSGDEINIIKAGKNYGWPLISYGLEDNGKPVNNTGLTQKEGLEQPVYYWDPAVAPSGMTFYTGNLIPEWRNNLFVGALRGSHIIRLVIDHKTNRVIGEERLLAKEQQRFRHIVQGPDEALYAITHQGRLYRIGN